jgi:hypothetical protein
MTNGPAAEIAGEEAHDDAEPAGDQHDHGADQERDPRAVDHPREHVAAEMVGAEEVRPAPVGIPEGRVEPVAQRLGGGIVGRDDVGEDGDEDEGEDHQEAEEAGLVVPQLLAHAAHGGEQLVGPAGEVLAGRLQEGGGRGRGGVVGVGHLRPASPAGRSPCGRRRWRC